MESYKQLDDWEAERNSFADLLFRIKALGHSEPEGGSFEKRKTDGSVMLLWNH